MSAKKKLPKMREKKEPLTSSRDIKLHGKSAPLRSQTEHALRGFLDNLNGRAPSHLYDLVIQEVEEPLLKIVMGHAGGNQSRAATILGMSRVTLKKKLMKFAITD